jgi:hypothetical protein
MATALLTLLLAGAGFAGSAGAATIGYVYSTSLVPEGEQLQGFSLGEHGELNLATSVKLTDSYGLGVAVAPTSSGVYVYALSSTTTSQTSAELDAYKVDTSNGSLTRIGGLEVADVCKISGDPGLLVFDEEGAGPVKLFAPACEYTKEEGETVGLKTFTVDTETGIPTESLFIHEKETAGIFGVGLAGNQLTYIFEQKREAFLQPLRINTTSGVVEYLPEQGLSGGPEDREKAYTGAATTDRFAVGGFVPEEATQQKGVAQFGFGESFAQVTPYTEGVTALAYSPFALVAGEEGPQVEFLTIGSGDALDTVNLTDPPTSLPAYEQPDGDAIISVYTLGPFVYLGIYGEGIVQMIDEPGTPITFPEDPFAAGGADVSIDGMDGFLTGTIPPQEETKDKAKEKTTTSETPAGKPPAPITSGGPVPKAIVLSGPGKAKLGSGAVKLEVTCGLPCTVSGSVVPPGVRAAGSPAPRALAFKSVHLPGSGKPVLVTLKFTSAQRKLVARLLKRHRRVVARIRVAEAPGGAPPRLETIRIV